MTGELQSSFKTILQRDNSEIIHRRTLAMDAITEILDEADHDDNSDATTSILLTTARVAVEVEIMHALWDITDILRTRP